MNNPDILLSLVGVAGLISVAATALLSRDTTKNILSSVGEKIDRVESSISFVKGKIDSLERILSDGVISPTEVTEIQDGFTEVKDKISGIMGSGGDAA